MQSLYDDIFATLEGHTFTIADVSVRKPYDKAPKTYPSIVVHEIVNLPKNHGTVNGETRTRLAYQLDIQTSQVVDRVGVVLSEWDAGRRLVAEVSELLEADYKITRSMTYPPERIASDVLSHIWRGDCVVEDGYVYRN